MRKTRNAVLATAAEPTEPAVPTVGHNNPPSPITDEPLWNQAIATLSAGTTNNRLA